MRPVNEPRSEDMKPLRIEEGVFGVADGLSLTTIPEASEIWQAFGIEQGPLTRMIAALLEYDKRHGYSPEETAIRVAYLTLQASALQQYRVSYNALLHSLFADGFSDKQERHPDLIQNSLLDPPLAA